MDPPRWTALTREVNTALARPEVAGVIIVITSRVPNGRVIPNYGWEGGGKTLVEAGAVMATTCLRRKPESC